MTVLVFRFHSCDLLLYELRMLTKTALLCGLYTSTGSQALRIKSIKEQTKLGGCVNNIPP